MKKLIHYILIGIMLNWNVAVFAETDQGCSNWEVVEETDKYIQESCADAGKMQARIRSKPVEGLNIIVVESPEEKKQNPKSRNTRKKSPLKGLRGPQYP